MIRENKFRAKNIKTNQWVYGGYYKHLKRTPSPIGDKIKKDDYISLISTSGFSDWNMPKPVEYFAVEENTVGQYTGLKDKNEKEIYEGDIVEIGDFTYSIKFEIGSFMLVRCSDETDMYAEFDNCWNDEVYPLCQLHWESNAEENMLYNCEVIGNIYDNQELLNA